MTDFWSKAFVCFVPLLMITALTCLILCLSDVRKENIRINSFIDKTATVSVFDDNRNPKKIDVRILRRGGSLSSNVRFICRVDYGAGIFKRFSEVEFNEAELEFPVEAKQ